MKSPLPFAAAGAALLVLLAVAAVPAAPAPVPETLRNVHRIVTLGDSITQQGGKPGGYVSQVAYYLKTLFPEHPIEIINAGISGHKSSDMRGRFERDVLERKPDLATISVGINDVWHGFDAEHPKGGGPRGVPLVGFRENVGAMLEAAKAAGVKVVVFTTTIFEDELESPRNEMLKEYNQALRQLAERYGARLADQNAAFTRAWRTALKEQGARLTTDQVHMAPAGNRLMARVALLALGVPERLLNETLPDPGSVTPQEVVCTRDYSEGVVVDWDGNLFFSHGKTVTRVTPGGNPTEWATLGAPNGHKILPTGNHLVCDGERHAVLELDPNGREVRSAAAECDGKPLRAPNDLSLDPEGGFYFTDPGDSNRERPDGSVYHVTEGGFVTRFATGLAYPNGVALAANRRRLYVAESEQNRILVWDLVSPGKPAGEPRVFAALPPPDSPGGKALPDGIAFDARGNLWVAHFGTQRVRVLDPDGRLVASYDGGNRTTSNLCFGGPDLDDLFVTGGEPGCLFRLDVGVPGQRLLPNRRPKPPRAPKDEKDPKKKQE